MAAAAKSALGGLPGWTLQGAGKGPGGWSLQAVRRPAHGASKHEVTVRVVAEGGRDRGQGAIPLTRGPLSIFGQNARNIRELLAALDHELR